MWETDIRKIMVPGKIIFPDPISMEKKIGIVLQFCHSRDRGKLKREASVGKK
jgi:hypothetical protein